VRSAIVVASDKADLTAQRICIKFRFNLNKTVSNTSEIMRKAFRDALGAAYKSVNGI